MTRATIEQERLQGMKPDYDRSQIFGLGPLLLDTGRRTLSRDGEGVPVEPAVFALLVHLVQNRDRACDREEILRACWPDVAVTPSALDSAIKRLRRALGDDGAQQDWIATIRGFGFRFVGPCDRQASENPSPSWGSGLKIVVCDDHAIFREGLKITLRETRAEILDASNASDALALIAANPDVDLVLLDLQMPGPDGWDALARLRRDHPATPVVVVSAHEDTDTIARAVDGGASGYIPKSSPPQVLLAALRFVMDGGLYVPPDPLQPSVESDANLSDPSSMPSPETHFPPLTTRQRQMLESIARGESNAEIASRLGIAEGTVKAHLNGLFRLLGVKNRTEAAIIGLRIEN